MQLPAIFEDFLGLIYPECCHACHRPLVRGEHLICTACKYHMPRTNHHLEKVSPLRKKFDGKVKVDHALAYLKFTKQESVQQLVASFKYKRNQEIGLKLGNWYGSELKKAGITESFDCFVPIPLHPSKLQWRGFNQSEVFSRGLSESTGVPTIEFLRRKTATATQTKKGRMERWSNVSNVFKTANPKLLQGKHVVVVDDIVTTGATLESGAVALLKSGAKKVSVLALAEAQLM